MQQRSQGLLRPMPPLPPPGGTNPDRDMLNQLKVDFSVEPSTISICTTSESVKFDWMVTGVPNTVLSEILFTLHIGTTTASVGPSGSRLVQISGPTAFGFFANLHNAGRILLIGSITAVPSPNAIEFAVSTASFANYANPQVRQAVADTLDNYAQLRGDPNWSIDSSGIHGHLPFAVPTGVDLINVDVDLTLLPVLNQGNLSLVYTDFNVHADFPWYVIAFNPVEVTAVEVVINYILIPAFKPELADLLRQMLNKVVIPQPPCPIRQVQLQAGQIVVTLCCPQ